ncbi:hypothetical protein ACFE04_019533 [Oxalis oulophora]
MLKSVITQMNPSMDVDAINVMMPLIPRDANSGFNSSTAMHIPNNEVFPSYYSIKAALGNLRINDDSLPSSHMYFLMCDMRNPEGSSFVEVVSYFMGLVPNDAKGVVKLKDQVTNSENYLKLDVVHITVQNSFQWFGGDKNDINDVQLETLSVMIEELKASLSTKESSLKLCYRNLSFLRLQNLLKQRLQVGIAKIVSVVVNLIELCLCTCEGRDASLATVQVYICFFSS